jgi:hypothetical protein
MLTDPPKKDGWGLLRRAEGDGLWGNADADVASARSLGVERMPEQLEAGAGGDDELAGGAGDVDRRADCGQRSGAAEPAFRLERGRCAAPER